jgi:hypothetical protein
MAELERSGNVTVREQLVYLTSREYIPLARVEEGYAQVGTEFEDLLAAAEENILRDEQPKNAHLRTEYDNIPRSRSRLVKEWLLKETGELHARARAFLSTLDRDTAADTARVLGEYPEGWYSEREPDGDLLGRLRVSISSFSRVEEFAKESASQSTVRAESEIKERD